MSKERGGFAADPPEKEQERAMFIWTGIDVDEQLAGIRDRVRQLEKEQGVTNSNLTLPFHISLKILIFVRKSIGGFYNHEINHLFC